MLGVKIIYKSEIDLHSAKLIAAIHKDVLATGILSGFDNIDLALMYMKFLSRKQNSIILACNNDNLLGFALISLNGDSLLPPITIKSLKYVLKSLRIKDNQILVYNKLREVFMRGETVPELVSFAVEERYQGQGIGRLLLENVFEFCRNNNYKLLRTKTHNSRLAEFYLKNYICTKDSEKNLGKYEQFTMMLKI